MEGNTASRKDFFVPVFLLLLSLLFLGIYLLVRKSSTPSVKPHAKNDGSLVKKITSVPKKVQGSMELKKKDEAEGISLSRSFDVVLAADSRQIPVTGYDAVVEYDPQYLSYEENENLLPLLYKTKVQKTDKGIVISAYLNKPDTQAASLDNTQLLTLRFKALKPGRSEMLLAFEKGSKSDSNLISNTSQDILDQVKSLHLTVGHELLLKVNETKAVPQTGYKIKLTKISIPTDECRDCIESADLQLIDEAGQEYEVGFRSGGFAGNMINEVRAQGFLITLSRLTENAATIFVVPE